MSLAISPFSSAFSVALLSPAFSLGRSRRRPRHTLGHPAVPLGRCAFGRGLSGRKRDVVGDTPTHLAIAVKANSSYLEMATRKHDDRKHRFPSDELCGPNANTLGCRRPTEPYTNFHGNINIRLISLYPTRSKHRSDNPQGGPATIRCRAGHRHDLRQCRRRPDRHRVRGMVCPYGGRLHCGREDCDGGSGGAGSHRNGFGSSQNPTQFPTQTSIPPGQAC